MRREVELALVDEVLAAHAARGDERAVVVVASGANRVSVDKVSVLVGDELAPANASFVKKTVGYAVGGVPIAVVRRPDGTVAAYENVCRHRAAPVVRGRGHASRAFACPFHGWTYDTRDGRLRGRPHACEGFASVDEWELGLRPLAVAERAGLRPGSLEVLCSPGRSPGEHSAQGLRCREHEFRNVRAAGIAVRGVVLMAELPMTHDPVGPADLGVCRPQQPRVEAALLSHAIGGHEASWFLTGPPRRRAA